MLDAMDRWATNGTPPPDSMMPSCEIGTLATYEEWFEGFQKIPGQALPPGPSALPLLDFGSDADDGFLAKLPQDIKDLKGYKILALSVMQTAMKSLGCVHPRCRRRSVPTRAGT